MQNSSKMTPDERRVFDAVSAGKQKFQEIFSAVGSRGVGNATRDGRKLDRILQRLRKRGLIEYRKGTGWRVEGAP